MFKATVYALIWGSDRQVEEETRFFTVSQYVDAVVRFSERVVDLDRDPDVHGAYVHLVQLASSGIPEDRQHACWTKCSNEGPTTDGYATEEEAREST